MPKIYDDLRQNIIKSAKRIIIKYGYRKLNMRDVAKETGVAVGTIYNYFPTRDALISELMFEYWKEFIASVQSIQESEDDIFAKFRRIYSVLADTIDVFKENWIRAEGTKTVLTEEHQIQKDGIMKLFHQVVEKELMTYRNQSPDKVRTISDRELSIFIVANFMMIAQTKELRYETFEKILRSYF